MSIDLDQVFLRPTGSLVNADFLLGHTKSTSHSFMWKCLLYKLKLSKKKMHCILNDTVLAKPYKLEFFIWDMANFDLTPILSISFNFTHNSLLNS